MKAAVTEGAGQGFVVRDIQIEDPIGREVLVHVKASGLCHTDLTIATHGMGFPLPAVLGHEVAGVVAAVGPAVTSVSVGQHVVGSSLMTCGACANCLAGRPTICTKPGALLRQKGSRLHDGNTPLAQYLGVGGFAEYTLNHENQLVVMPEDIPFAQASLLGCSVMTGVGVVLNTAQVAAGETVVIVGAGGVGLNAISGALIAGAAQVIAIDIDDSKLTKARAFGATQTINSSATDAVAQVQRLTGGGADHVFDVVGLSAVLQQSIEMVAPGGDLYLVGVAGPDASVTVSAQDAVMRQVSIHGVQLGSTNPQRDLPVYADLYRAGRLKLDELISAEITLGEIERGYEMLRDPAVTRVVISMP